MADDRVLGESALRNTGRVLGETAVGGKKRKPPPIPLAARGKLALLVVTSKPYEVYPGTGIAAKYDDHWGDFMRMEYGATSTEVCQTEYELIKIVERYSEIGMLTLCYPGEGLRLYNDPEIRLYTFPANLKAHMTGIPTTVRRIDLFAMNCSGAPVEQFFDMAIAFRADIVTAWSMHRHTGTLQREFKPWYVQSDIERDLGDYKDWLSPTGPDAAEAFRRKRDEGAMTVVFAYEAFCDKPPFEHPKLDPSSFKLRRSDATVTAFTARHAKLTIPPDDGSLRQYVFMPHLP
jgi:hypothetical protein